MKTHVIRHLAAAPALNGRWDSPPWNVLSAVEIAHFHPRSSAHHPRVRARLAYSEGALHCLFDVQDRYVRALCMRYGEQVCKDSCVELFIQPRPEMGYFNFEVNCGGTMLLWYVTDPSPRADGPGLREAVEVPLALAQSIGIYHNLPRQVRVEIPEEMDWRLQLSIPMSLLENYVGALGPLSGQMWRGNLFKCADHTSHPHWAAWNPIGEALNFHAPEYFGELRFE